MSTPHTIGDPAELAALFVSGALTASETAEFEAHLDAGCPTCRQEVRALEPVVQAMTDVAPLSPSADTRAALMRRVRAAGAKKNDRPFGDGASVAGGDTAHVDPQIWRDWAGDAVRGGLFIQRGDSAQWDGVGIDGIQIRKLFVDRKRNQLTMLVRMAAGTAYPRHIHDGPEECYVLEGDLQMGDQTLRAGDFQRCEPGTLHSVQSTENGCLLLIASSLSDELVD